ncbi:hypothetical protein [Flavobacterium sp.]|uniref:hypothetical protein n=1 Tax=Flavobacterium sp. TaxID=239 RepID=UPI00260D9ED7|nr:hypothetical protein [Flavobacterium sp.]
MKKWLLVLLILASSNLFAQYSDKYAKYLVELRKNTVIDKKDREVYNLLEAFYNDCLQADDGALKTETSRKINEFYNNPNSKNKSIFNMFFAYQNHISETAAAGKEPDSRFQVDIINDLEKEIISIYGTVPTIVFIYKAEALNSNRQFAEAAEVISKGLQLFPNSIPLKVYKYMDSKELNLKADLLKNHSQHWMVKQFEIK